MVGKQRRTVKKLHKRRNILKGYSKKKPHYIQKKSRRKKTSYKRKRPNKRTRGKRRKFILSGGSDPPLHVKKKLAQTAMDDKFGPGTFSPSVFGTGHASGIEKIVRRAEVLFPQLKKKDADAVWFQAVDPNSGNTYYYDKHGNLEWTQPTMRRDGRNVLEDDRAFWMTAMQRAAEEVSAAYAQLPRVSEAAVGVEEEEEEGGGEAPGQVVDIQPGLRRRGASKSPSRPAAHRSLLQTYPEEDECDGGLCDRVARLFWPSPKRLHKSVT
jgi:hypothetical protein